MLTYIELIDLRDKLANGDIDLKSAKVEFWIRYKEVKRS